MDKDFRRPRYHASVAQSFAPALATATATQHVASAMSSGSAPTVAPVPVIAGTDTAAQPKNIDFSLGAKAYKKRIFRQSVAHGFAIGVYVMLGFAIVLAAGGVYVNKKYSGKALPFTYVGDISVGGLTESEIKNALDYQLSDMKISFVDGGLVRQVPISQFAVKVDTSAVAYEATHQRFNPFAYLNKRRYDAAVTVNERLVNGYLATTINSSKTVSENAKLVIEKKKLKIQPETQGFRANPQYINDRLKVALSNMSTPVINVNMVTIKPSVYSTDLEDDLARANTLVNSAVALQYGKTVIKPTADEKLSWLQMSETPGANNVNLSFSKPLVRQYVITQANKFQASSGVSKDTVKDAIATTDKGTVIDNIDEATDALVSALNNGKPLTQKLTSKIGTYNKVVSVNQ